MDLLHGQANSNASENDSSTNSARIEADFEGNEKSGESTNVANGNSEKSQPQHKNHHTKSAPRVVKVMPDFVTNQPPIDYCSSDTCQTLPPQPSNFVYLRTQPAEAAPLLTDPYMHPDGSPGTTRIWDWSAKASSGRKFVVADQRDDWTGIWYGGKIGWFHNPGGSITKTSWSKTLTPKPGLDSVPLYGGAYPEDSAYPSTITPRLRVPLYQLPAGQHYPTHGKVPTDYFYDATYNYSLPDDHMIVRGDEKFYQISFNHRFFYVKANDVIVKY